MKFRHEYLFVPILFILLVSGCKNSSILLPSNSPAESTPLENKSSVLEPSPAPESNAPLALIEFRVVVPEETDLSDEIYLTVLDEVTGLYLNSQKYLMALNEQTGAYSVSLPFTLGSVVKYRYERQTDELLVAEHIADGSPVRYRMYMADGPGSVDDVVSRWTNTEYTSQSGRIMGQALDVASGLPIPDLMISVGGAQVFTSADGSFLVEGLPPGTHNLVGYAPDGAYQVFQQGAVIAAESTTPVQIMLNPAQMVNITFQVSPPENTPPLVPLRVAGNLLQLGNTFGTLTGGVSTLAARMPVLTSLPDGRYEITLKLPAGADIRYKFTLGDGFWNAERDSKGDLRLRQLIVPAQDTVIAETIDSWQTDPDEFLVFDITVPDSTPVEDFVSIQLNPLFGWTEPFPMWSLGEHRWAYVLYGPLNLPGNLSYRYCRNDQCGVADDIETPGLYGAGRSVSLDELPKQFKDTVNGWVGLGGAVDPVNGPADGLINRGDSFTAAVEVQPQYHPSWDQRNSYAWTDVAQSGANWLFLDPTWTVTTNNPPLSRLVAGSDQLWPDLLNSIQEAHNQGLKVAIKPTLNFDHLPQPDCEDSACPSKEDAWWAGGSRDFSWWLQWFDYYRDFVIHHADLAAASNADALILGGDWLNPALPSGVLSDGSSSGVPSDAEQRWRDLIGEARSRYSGQIIWAVPYKNGQLVPDFMDAVDQIYVEWPVAPSSPDTPQPGLDELEAELGAQIDNNFKPFTESTGKPLIIGLKTGSNPDMLTQENTYQAALSAVNTRDWIAGFVSQGYYPPAKIQDEGVSIHGKSAEQLLKVWFQGFLGSVPAP